jgi:hypothetical protein
MTIIASDPFTGTGNAPLSANWTAGSHTGFAPVLLNNEAYDNQPAVTADAYWSAAAWPNNGYSEVVLGTVISTVTDEGVGPSFRTQDPATSGKYLAQTNSHETRLYVTLTGSTFTQLGSDGPAGAAGDRLRLICNGNQISVTLNGTVIIGPVTDTTLTSGNAGIWTTQLGGPGTLASWEAGNLLGPTFTLQPTDQTIPVGASVTFSTTATGNGAVTYQWQDDRASPGTFANIGGANASSYSFVPNGSESNRHYKVLATDNDGTVASVVVTLRVLVNAPTPVPEDVIPWQPRDNVSARLWAPLVDVSGWLPSTVALQIQKWFYEWLEVPPAPGATTINTTVGNLALGSVAARVALTTVIRGTVANLTLGSISARVQLATAVNAAKATLQLNGTPSRVQIATAINTARGLLTLGRVSASVPVTVVVRAIPANLTLGAVAARIQLATAINAVKSTLNLNGVPAQIDARATTSINCTVGGMTLGRVNARIVSTTGIGAVPAALTLGSRPAAVIQTTVIPAVRSALTLGRVGAQVQIATAINCSVGGMTLGRVNARVQLATAINATPKALTLGSRAATVLVRETITVNTRVGVLTLAGTPAQVTTQAPAPPPPPAPVQTVGGGGGPGQLIVRRKRVKVAVHDAIDDRLVIVARSTPVIKPLAQQVAAIIQQVSDASRVVQRSHWTPAHARLHIFDEVDDTVLAKVEASDPDLQDFFDLLMEADA